MQMVEDSPRLACARHGYESNDGLSRNLFGVAPIILLLLALGRFAGPTPAHAVPVGGSGSVGAFLGGTRTDAIGSCWMWLKGAPVPGLCLWKLNTGAKSFSVTVYPLSLASQHCLKRLVGGGAGCVKLS